jgi:hypothetical protein
MNSRKVAGIAFGVMAVVWWMLGNAFAQYGKVSGRVMDAAAKVPLNRVNVVLSNGMGKGAVTDIDGDYYMLGLPPGTYQMTFSRVGYNTVEYHDVEVWADLTTRIDVEMTPYDFSPHIEVREYEPAALHMFEQVADTEEVRDPEPPRVSSDKLEQTVISAHMEVPIVPGKNVIYCSTFQIAWNSLQDSVIGEEILLEGDSEIARMLNKQLSTVADISEDCYVAMADVLTQEFLDRINGALEEKFGEAAPPEVTEDIIPGLPQILSYAYLYKNLRFAHDFEILEQPIRFKSGNDTTKVKGFGVPRHGWRGKIREQVSVIDYNDRDDFIICLVSSSIDDEILLAKIPPQGTLLETIQLVQERTSRASPSKVEEDEPVEIPKCDFNVDHTFTELTGRFLKNQGWTDWFISKAIQWIRFNLSEKGVVIKSEARIVMDMGGHFYDPKRKPRRFIFDGPFLICLRQKGGRYPYFAMWVDNAELLVKE